MNWVKIVEGEIPKIKKGADVLLRDGRKYVAAVFSLHNNCEKCKKQLGREDEICQTDWVCLDENKDYSWWNEWSKCDISKAMVTHYCVIEAPGNSKTDGLETKE